MSLPPPTRQPMTIWIGGVNVTNYVPPHTVTIEYQLQQITRATFTIKNGGALTLEKYQRVLIADSNLSTTYFYGYLMEFPEEKYDNGVELDYACECSGEEMRLQRSALNGNFYGTDGDILADLLSNSLPDELEALFDFSTYVDSLLADSMDFNVNDGNLLDALDDLATQTGAQWDLTSRSKDIARFNLNYNPALNEDMDYYSGDIAPYSSYNNVWGSWNPNNVAWSSSGGESGGGLVISSQGIVFQSITYYVCLWRIGRADDNDPFTFEFSKKEDTGEGIWVCVSMRLYQDSDGSTPVQIEMNVYDETGTFWDSFSLEDPTVYEDEWNTVAKTFELSETDGDGNPRWPDSGTFEIQCWSFDLSSPGWQMKVDFVQVEIVGYSDTEEGSDVVVNGGFDTDTDWVKGAGWAISGGVATHTPGSTEAIYQENIITPNNRYKVEFTISNWTAGTLQLAGSDLPRSSNDTFTEILILEAEDLIFYPSTGFDGDLDNVSCLPIISNPPTDTTLGSELVTNGSFSSDTDWTKGANWAIASGVATHTPGSTEKLTQASMVEIDELYQVTFTIKNYVAGTITSELGAAGTARSGDGTYSEQITATAVDLSFAPTSTFNGDIDDASVKKVVDAEWPRDYFDGDSENAEWLGTPNESPSALLATPLQWGNTPPDAPFDINIGVGDEFVSGLDLDFPALDGINAIIVSGGYEYIDIIYISAGNGIQDTFDLYTRMFAPSGSSGIEVDKNTGTDESPIWTPVTVNTPETEPSGNNVIWYDYDDNSWLVFGTAPPALERSWRVTARIRKRIRVEVKDETAIAEDGITLYDTIYDESITTTDQAFSIGNRELENRTAPVGASFICYEPGLLPGQAISLTDTTRGLDEADLVIQRVSMTFLGGGYTRSAVECGARQTDLVDMIAENRRRSTDRPGVDEPTESATLSPLIDQDEKFLLDQDNKIIYDTVRS